MVGSHTVLQSPHVSDDNPYSEALFRTLKHTPAYPRLPFESLACARRWMTAFAAWYNGSIGTVDPVCDPG